LPKPIKRWSKTILDRVSPRSERRAKHFDH
jgi:hypothetical protein